jgi:hypothetical protein
MLKIEASTIPAVIREVVMRTNFFANITVLLLVLVSCKEGAVEIDNNDPVPVPFEVLGALSSGSIVVNLCWLYPANMNVGPDSIELIITDPEDFEAYVKCRDEQENTPDFDTHFVLAGLSTSYPQCVLVKELDVYLSEGVLVYEVIIGDMGCQVPDRAQYIVKIPKEYSEYSVEFAIIKERP